MKTRLTVSILLLISLSLAGFAWYQYQEIVRLRATLAETHSGSAEPSETRDPRDDEVTHLRAQLEESEAAARELRHQVATHEAEQAAVEDAATKRKREDTSLMSDMVKLIEDNPAINEMMTVQQRSTLQYLYRDLIKRFQLSPEEEDYFVDLLLARQMQQVSWALKGMSGNADPAELEAARTAMLETQEAVKDEVKSFLNSDADFDTFSHFEETLGVRMEVDNFSKVVATAGEPLDDGLYDVVIDAIYEGRKNYNFSNNFNSSDATDFNFSGITDAAIDQHMAEMREANALIAQNLASLLSPAQYQALLQAQEQAAATQAASLRMASKMFGGGETQPTP